jgi:HTH-type transcriptional regulator/antitoxin HigA
MVFLMGDDLKTTSMSPAQFIRRELESRGMTQIELAFILGVPQQAVNQLALARRGISAALAKDLGAAFGVSPEFLLKMQKEHEIADELARARDPKPEIARKAKLVSTYPVREMAKRGWIGSDRDSLEAEVMRFFGTKTADEPPQLTCFAKKSDYEESSPEQMAWVFRVRQIAQRLVVPAYSEKKLQGEIQTLRSLLKEPEDASRVPRILADCGVRFVVVEGLPGGKIDGVCFWLEDGTVPVVGMSMRFDRIDNFWFVLRHELEHVLQRHGVDAVMLDTDLASEASGDDSDLPVEEQIANAAASDFCVSKAKMDSWFARKSPFFSENDLIGFAKTQNVHPGIVAGQLRHRTKKYTLFSTFIAKIRHVVVTSAVVDGWGETYPTA